MGQVLDARSLLRCLCSRGKGGGDQQGQAGQGQERSRGLGSSLIELLGGVLEASKDKAASQDLVDRQYEVEK